MRRDAKTRSKSLHNEPSKREAKLLYRHVVKDSAELLEAMGSEGLDEELALLRIRFEEMLKDEDTDIDKLLRAAEMIGRTVMRRHRISAKRSDELAENVAAAMKSITDQLFPERLEV